MPYEITGIEERDHDAEYPVRVFVRNPVTRKTRVLAYTYKVQAAQVLADIIELNHETEDARVTMLRDELIPLATGQDDQG